MSRRRFTRVTTQQRLCGRSAGPVGMAVASVLERLEGRTLLSTIAVTTFFDTTDVNPATITVAQLSSLTYNPDGVTSLREAIQAARNTAGADTVNLPAGTYGLGSELLYSPASTQDALTLKSTGGDGAAIIDAGGTSRVLQIGGPATITLDGLAIRNGNTFGSGGAIQTSSPLVLTHCTFTNNKAVGANGVNGEESSDGNGQPGEDATGGAIFATAELTIESCTFLQNRAAGGAGGLGWYDGGNTGGRGGNARGGAVYSAGPMTVNNSTFSQNTAVGGIGGMGQYTGGMPGDGGDAQGGGIYLISGARTAFFTACTIQGNEALVGAGGNGYYLGGTAGVASGGGLYITLGVNVTITNGSIAGNAVNSDTSYDTNDGYGNTIDGATDARGGGIYNNGSLSVSDVSFTGNLAQGGTGQATDYIGRPGGAGLGGGICNAESGTLSLVRASFAQNTALGGEGGPGLFEYYKGTAGVGAGGAVYNLHSLSADTCTFSTNSADLGGALANKATAVVTASTFSANAARNAGAISNTSALTLARSTLSGNTAVAPAAGGAMSSGPSSDGGKGDSAFGGGLQNSGTATLVQCTFAGNSVIGGDGGNGTYDGFGGNGGDAGGGAIHNANGTLSLIACTISANTATPGKAGKGGPGDEYNPAGKDGVGGVGSAGGVFNATVAVARLAGTIVAQNAAATRNPDVRGAFLSGPANKGGANFIGDRADATGFSATADFTGTSAHVLNAKLAALSDNGGPTQTMALQPGSPALGVGNNSYVVGTDSKPLTTDQRGAVFARVVGSRVDIGAYEEQRKTASIAGTVFCDVNRNGARDAGDVPLTGWSIYCDQNDNGQLDTGEPTAVSGADGGYSITGLAPERYGRIREYRQDGWTRSKPTGVYPLGYYDVTVTTGESSAGHDFGNYRNVPIAPVATDDSVTTRQDQPVTIDVLANDSDDVAIVAGSVAVASPPTHGSVAVDSATGRVTYTPAAGYFGNDAFTYSVADVEGAASNAATVSINVTPVVSEPEPVLGVAVTGTLPSAVVGGTRAKASQRITLTNLTSQVMTGPVTVRVAVSADDVLDSGDAPLATLLVKKLKLQPNASKTFTLKIGSFPAVTDGTYCLMAQASHATGDSRPAESAADVVIAAPFVDLAATFAPAPTTLRVGRSNTLRLSLKNLGNVAAKGIATVTVNLTDAVGPAIPLLTTPVKVNLGAGKAKVFKLKVKLPAGVTLESGTLAASLDGFSGIADRDPTNNAVSAAVLVVA